MKVLLAHNDYSVRGGAEVFVHEVRRILREAGHEVELFTCFEENLESSYSAKFPVVEHYSSGGLINKVARVPQVIYNRHARASMAEILEDFRPDIVHAFAIYGRLTPSILEAANAAKVPTVLSCNDYKHICPNYKLFHHGRLCEDCKGGRFISALKNRCCHDSLAISAVGSLEGYTHELMNVWRGNVDRFLFASQFMLGKTREFWADADFSTDILRNPFDAEKYHVPLNCGGNILYFGRLIEEKGVNLLLEAAIAAPDVPVVIVGDGPDRDQVAAAAGELENVRFVGPAWGDDLKTHLHEARAVVVPSLWHENFPYVILQAFAAGKPVIGSRRGGIPELIEAGDHGWLFDPTEVAELAAIMQRAARLSEAVILSMGAQAQNYVSVNFNDDAIYSELSRIYSEVLQ